MELADEVFQVHACDISKDNKYIALSLRKREKHSIAIKNLSTLKNGSFLTIEIEDATLDEYCTFFTD